MMGPSGGSLALISASCRQEAHTYRPTHHPLPPVYCVNVLICLHEPSFAGAAISFKGTRSGFIQGNRGGDLASRSPRFLLGGAKSPMSGSRDRVVRENLFKNSGGKFLSAEIGGPSHARIKANLLWRLTHSGLANPGPVAFFPLTFKAPRT